MHNMGHGMHEIGQLCVSVISDAALASEMVMVGWDELVEGHLTSWTVLH